MTETVVMKLEQNAGGYVLTGRRSRIISNVLLAILPIFALGVWAAFMQEDSFHLGLFTMFAGIVAILIYYLRIAPRRFSRASITPSQISFSPTELTILADEIKEIWFEKTPSGDDLIVMKLKSPKFIPYFGTVWCFGKTLAINTE